MSADPSRPLPSALIERLADLLAAAVVKDVRKNLAQTVDETARSQSPPPTVINESLRSSQAPSTTPPAAMTTTPFTSLILTAPTSMPAITLAPTREAPG